MSTPLSASSHIEYNKNKKNTMHDRSYRSICTSSTGSSPSSSLAATSASVTTGPSRLPSSSLMMGGNPKPVKDKNDDWQNLIPGILNKAGKLTNRQVLEHLGMAATSLRNSTGFDYWLSDAGQSELLRKIQDEAKPPTEPAPWGRSTGVASATISMFDYTDESKAKLERGTLSAVGEDEWLEIELTADSGACDTVIPCTTAESIPIVPSLASLRGMEYEVANGQSIPNLGERRCLVWTEGATEAKTMNMQVADVHKGLLSLSRCADMGFEGRFGRRAGALICERTGEVVPLVRKGNLYMLKL